MPVDKQKRRTGRRGDNVLQAPYPSSSTTTSTDFALGGADSTEMGEEFRFDDVHSREMELKRSRGEISCAECRRLKIKCDKQVPCQSCQRRGCATLCPNGSLATGQGTRFVLAATEHLHKKISRYGARVRELEDALAALQSKHSKESHPLLESSDTLDGGVEALGTAHDDAAIADGEEQQKEKERDRTVIADAFGTLSIAEHGVSRFYGPTGGIESLLIGAAPGGSRQRLGEDLHLVQAINEHAGSLSPPESSTSYQSSSSYPQPSSSSSTSAPIPSATPPNSNPAPLFSRIFPFTPLGTTPDILATIKTHLPPPHRARQLLEVYFEQAYWLFRGVTKEQAYGELVRGMYGVEASGWGKSPAHAAAESNEKGDEDEEEAELDADAEAAYDLGPHDVAVLFLLFAIGAVMEPTPGSKAGAAVSGPSTVGDAESESSSIRRTEDSMRVDSQPYGQSVYGPYHPGVQGSSHPGVQASSSPSSFSSRTHSAGSSPSASNQAQSYGQGDTQPQTNSYSQHRSHPHSHPHSHSHPHAQAHAPSHAQSQSHSQSRSHSQPYSHPQAQSHSQHGPPSQSPSPQSLQASLHEAQLLGEHYHQLGQAAMCLQPVLEQPGVATVQGLHLMSMFNAFAESERSDASSMEASWSLITMAANLSQTIGLHRDSARWGLPEKLVRRRRLIFWDLFVADVWSSLHTGRPPTFSLEYVDCHYPGHPVSDDDAMANIDVDETLLRKDVKASRPKGKSGDNVELWGFRFAGEVVAEVAAKTLTAVPPTYETIMALDRKVREFPLWFAEGGDGALGSAKGSEKDIAGTMEHTVGTHIKEVVLLWIHRAFFAQAIMDNPVNPLKSTYAPSFLAAYRGSGIILTSVKAQFEMFPVMVTRFWSMLTFAFSAAVVFGTVVTRGPKSPLAPQAMLELEQACTLFAKASVYSMRARKALTILKTLHSKARVALAAATQQKGSGAEDSGVHWRGPGIDEPTKGLSPIGKDLNPDDELSIFAGRTRFVDRTAESGSESPVSSGRGSAHHQSRSQDGHQPGRGEHGGGVALHAPPIQVPSQVGEDKLPTEQQTGPPCIQLVQMKQEQDVVELMPPYLDEAPVQTQTSHHLHLSSQHPHHHSYMSNAVASGSGQQSSSAWMYDQQTHSSSDSPPDTVEYRADPFPLSNMYPTSADRGGALESGIDARYDAWQGPTVSQSAYAYGDAEQQYYNTGNYQAQSSSHHHTRTQPAQPEYHSGPDPYASELLSTGYSGSYSHRAQSRLQHPHMQEPSQSVHPTHHHPTSVPSHPYEDAAAQYYSGSHSYANVHSHPHSQAQELAGLGLASRDSALDQRWSSFMQDSGILEGDHAHRGGHGMGYPSHR